MLIMKKCFLAALAVALGLAGAHAGGIDYRVIPLPVSIDVDASQVPFTLGGQVEIVAHDSLANEAAFMRQFLPEGLWKGSSGNIVLSATLQDENPEAYTIDVRRDAVIINGASAAGVYRGVQTLRKSMPVSADGAVELPAVHIYDAPRFSYRGTHFDVSRHFFTTDEVKQFIDMVSLHGVNTLHWHLTDDQGWRIEIKKYPRLTEIGSYRPNSIIGHTGPEFDNVPVSGYYTQDEVRDIVDYAAKRHVQIVPEIDLPSHMQAALAAYPQFGCTGHGYQVWCQWGVSDNVLCPGKDSTMVFLKDVIDEVAELFPAPYFHIGGDECPRTIWITCPHCQAKIKELGLVEKNGVSPEAQLQGYVTRFACDVVKSHGKSAIGWDEILECEEIPQDAVVMSWRGVAGAEKGTARGHRVILTPSSHCYFDFYQSEDASKEPYAIGGFTPVRKVYSLEPTLPSMTEEQKKLVLGAQSNLWTEYIPTFSQAQYMELPRLAALCEVQWLEPDRKDFEDFKDRLPALLAIYDKMGYNYARHIIEPEVSFKVDTERGALRVALSALPGYKLTYTTDGSEPTIESNPYSEPLYIDAETRLRARAFDAAENGTSEIDEMIKPGMLSFSEVSLDPEPTADYLFDGASMLVDGRYGDTNYRNGKWLGFTGRDCNATIRLKEPRKLSRVSWNTCIRYWDGVMDSRGVEVYVSNDGGKTFTLVAAEDYPVMEETKEEYVARRTVSFPEVEADVVRVHIKGQNILPEGHYYAGYQGWLFVDEISAE